MLIQRLQHIQDTWNALVVRHDQAPKNHNVWHYHEELEFIQIAKGRGTFFAGDCIIKFNDGDSVLIGSDVPHYWLFDEEYVLPHRPAEVDIRVVHFKPAFMGKDFLALKESQSIKQTYQLAKRVCFFNGTEQAINTFFDRLIKQDPFKQLLALLETLDRIAQLEDHNLLISKRYNNLQQQEDYQRMNKILNYIRLSYKSKIQLESVAQLAGLTPNSFCRYFKQKTGKTLIQFVNELRISHACTLLSENETAIKQICFDCGFQNFVSFHKTFKNITSFTPIHYRNMLQKR